MQTRPRYIYKSDYCIKLLVWRMKINSRCMRKCESSNEFLLLLLCTIFSYFIHNYCSIKRGEFYIRKEFYKYLIWAINSHSIHAEATKAVKTIAYCCYLQQPKIEFYLSVRFAQAFTKILQGFSPSSYPHSRSTRTANRCK